ncbi:hypothetical protein KQI72_07975 [Eubacterium sp. MSJ-21]|nr:hypothetical protein [Eubacterium sp. MSJ-21]
MPYYISVLGDSISSFRGYCNNVIDNTDIYYYPNPGVPGCNVTEFYQTWMYDAIFTQLHSIILKIDYVAGSSVVGYSGTLDGHASSKYKMNNINRINNLTNNGVSPNAIFIFGGTNDLCQKANFNLDNFINNYANMINLILSNPLYANTKVLCITPFKNMLTVDDDKAGTFTFNNLNNVYSWINYIANQANQRYGNNRCFCCDLHDIHLENGVYSDQYSHPNVAGMHVIADRIAFVCSLCGIGDHYGN